MWRALSGERSVGGFRDGSSLIGPCASWSGTACYHGARSITLPGCGSFTHSRRLLSKTCLTCEKQASGLACQEHACIAGHSYRVLSGIIRLPWSMTETQRNHSHEINPESTRSAAPREQVRPPEPTDLQHRNEGSVHVFPSSTSHWTDVST